MSGSILRCEDIKKRLARLGCDPSEGPNSWNKRTGKDLTKAIELFNQAIGKDSKYSLAYVGLADSYNLLTDLR